MIDQEIRETALEERVVEKGINRCATVVKGGRRFSFSALVVVGDRSGRIGCGFGKANSVPAAVDKAVKDGKRSVLRVSLKDSTIPHTIMGRFGAARVLLKPASKGTGVIAGAAVRAVVELAGVHDILTKSFGSNNPINLVKATIDGLSRMKTKEQIEKLRGVSLSD